MKRVFKTFFLFVYGVFKLIFKPLSEKEYKEKLAKLKKKNMQKKYKYALKEERRRYKRNFKIETSKILAIYLFLMLNAIVIYAMVAMWVFADFTYLGVLISDIAAQVLIYAIYCMKAYHAKKQSENMKYKRERAAGTLGELLNAGSESKEYVPLTKGELSGFECQTEEIELN